MNNHETEFVAKNTITYASRNKTILDIINYHNNGNLNLQPSFQRKSVWTVKDRSALIDSLMRGYPIPAIFLYARSENGKTIYDVIDRKQRIETILMFMGILKGKFSLKCLSGKKLNRMSRM